MVQRWAVTPYPCQHCRRAWLRGARAGALAFFICRRCLLPLVLLAAAGGRHLRAPGVRGAVAADPRAFGFLELAFSCHSIHEASKRWLRGPLCIVAAAAAAAAGGTDGDSDR